MFDCGEGTQVQLMKSDLKAGKITKIFITHLHGDHLYGLPGLLCTISQSNQRSAPVTIYGPLGLAKYLRVSLGLSRSNLQFQYRVVEMVPTSDMYSETDAQLCNVDAEDTQKLHQSEVKGEIIHPIKQSGVHMWPLFYDRKVKVEAGRLDHTIPSFGFVFTEGDIKGSFDIQKLKSYGLQPGPICGTLQAGEEVTTPNGEMITLRDVTKPAVTGRKIVICGDSRDSTRLGPIAQNCDVFIHEATLQNDMVETAMERGHSTPDMAAQFALMANAKLLILTHFSQRYSISSSEEQKHTEVTVADLKAEAEAVFKQDVLLAEDFKTFDVKIQK